MEKKNAEYDLTGLKIFDYSEYSYIELSGFFNSESLSDKLVETWIPYFECHQCGRHDYCKFALPHHFVSYKRKEIKCGVVEKSIRNFVKHTFYLLKSNKKDIQQNYLYGLYFFQKYIYESEQQIGLFLEDDFLKWHGKYVPMVFGRISSLREYLNKFTENFKEIPELQTKKGMLFVEGYSEKVFIERLNQEGIISFSEFNIESYGGRNNKSPKKIKMLIDNYKKIGYDIYFQGDQDGTGIDIFQEHVKDNLLDVSHTFQFKYDFETSVPRKIFFEVLCHLKILNTSFNMYEEKIKGHNDSIVNILKIKFNTNIKDKKIIIADSIGKYLIAINWYSDKSFLKSELGKFLIFVKKINHDVLPF